MPFFAILPAPAGDEVPKAIFPSAVGALPLAGSSGATPMDQDGAPAPGSRKFSVGSQAMALRADHKEVISPFGGERAGLGCWACWHALPHCHSLSVALRSANRSM